MFYNLLPQRHHWMDKQHEVSEFVINETFGVPGVGTMVAGTVKCMLDCGELPRTVAGHTGIRSARGVAQCDQGTLGSSDPPWSSAPHTCLHADVSRTHIVAHVVQKFKS